MDLNRDMLWILIILIIYQIIYPCLRKWKNVFEMLFLYNKTISFSANTTDFCSNYTFVDNSNTPQPAGDPCSSNTTSFVPDVLVSINSTCIHTSAASSSQTSTSGKNLAQTTKQQSSNVSQIGTTWPTTTTTSTPGNDIFDIGSTMPVNSSTYSIITSTAEVTNSTRVNNSTYSITSFTKPVATGSTSSTWGTVQGNEGLTTNRDISTQVGTSTSGQERTTGGLTLPPTDPVSDLTEYVSTSEKSPSTTGESTISYFLFLTTTIIIIIIVIIVNIAVKGLIFPCYTSSMLQAKDYKEPKVNNVINMSATYNKLTRILFS